MFFFFYPLFPATASQRFLFPLYHGFYENNLQEKENQEKNVFLIIVFPILN